MKRLLRLARDLLCSRDGASAVEFALVVPIMLAVYVGTIEASTLISMDRKVQSVSGAVGDLVARADESLTANQMRDYFRAASGIMLPYQPEPVLQVVTAIAVDAAGDTEVLWTRQFTNGVYSATTPHNVGDEFPLPQEMIDISMGRTVIAAEASYTYTPLYGIVFSDIDLYRSSYFLPRFGGSISIN
jgi:Flp pilus assembly protein TadG